MPPPKPNNSDEQFDRLVTLCDEALAAGQALDPTYLTGESTKLLARLRRVRPVLERLEKDRRRSEAHSKETSRSETSSLERGPPTAPRFVLGTPNPHTNPLTLNRRSAAFS